MVRLKSLLLIICILAVAAVGSYFGKQTYDDFTKPGKAEGIDWGYLNR